MSELPDILDDRLGFARYWEIHGCPRCTVYPIAVGDGLLVNLSTSRYGEPGKAAREVNSI